MKCRGCQKDMEVKEQLAYGSFCEDCYADRSRWQPPTGIAQQNEFTRELIQTYGKQDKKDDTIKARAVGILCYGD